MRTMFARATVLLVGASASTAWAANPPDTTGNNIALQGSDTLEEVTKDLILDPTCAATLAGLGITYAGGGSGTGETAMSTVPPTQMEAPMSRFLGNSAAICVNKATAQGLVIGLDGLSILAKDSTAAACSAQAANSGAFNVTVGGTGATPVVGCPGCDAGLSSYTIKDSTAGAGDAWRDVLKLIYLGRGHDGTTNCAGDVRASLVKQFNAIFQGGTCASGTCPAGLRRAYRRGDASGTTDVFLSSLGIGGLASAQIAQTGAKANPFCNAFGMGNIYAGESDYRDQDPIKNQCDTTTSAGLLTAGEEVCQRNNGVGGPVGTPGTMGLVQVVEIPANLTVAQLYPTVLCGQGTFALALPKASGDPAALPNPPCPNGGQLSLAKCFQPYIADATAPLGKNFNCIARISPVQGASRNNTTDGRVYNLAVKDVTGKYLKDNFTVPVAPTNYPANPAVTQRLVTGAFFRAHMTKVAVGGGSTCQTADSTAQIGCLTQADGCTVGFAGKEGATGGAVSLDVNGVSPTSTNIAKLLINAPDKYPMSRKLYFNTEVGFNNLFAGSGEAALAKCFATTSLVAPIMAAHHFIPMNDPAVVAVNGTSKILCEDYQLNQCNSPATSGNPNGSCATLPANYIQ